LAAPAELRAGIRRQGPGLCLLRQGLIGGRHGTSGHRGRASAGRHGADLRCQERRAAADRREPAQRQAGDAHQRPRARRHPLHADADGALRRDGERPGPCRVDARCRGRREQGSPLRHGAAHARLGARPGPAARPLRACPRVAARRLRHRRAAGRPALEGAGGAWRHRVARRRHHRREGAGGRAQGRAHRVRIAFCRRHRDGPDGRRSCQGGHRDPQCGPRSGGLRPRRVPRRHGGRH
jgi:hypothetical protein